MAAVLDFLQDLKQTGKAAGNFAGLLHVLIGRRVQKSDGTAVSSGVTWRELAVLLKKVRWDKAAVRELGLDPAKLPPRDRLRFWYAAIAHAQVDSDAALQSGDRLARTLAAAGYLIGTAPRPEPKT